VIIRCVCHALSLIQLRISERSFYNRLLRTQLRRFTQYSVIRYFQSASRAHYPSALMYIAAKNPRCFQPVCEFQCNCNRTRQPCEKLLTRGVLSALTWHDFIIVSQGHLQVVGRSAVQALLPGSFLAYLIRKIFL